MSINQFLNSDAVSVLLFIPSYMDVDFNCRLLKTTGNYMHNIKRHGPKNSICDPLWNRFNIDTNVLLLFLIKLTSITSLFILTFDRCRTKIMIDKKFLGRLSFPFHWLYNYFLGTCTFLFLFLPCGPR